MATTLGRRHSISGAANSLCITLIESCCSLVNTRYASSCFILESHGRAMVRISRKSRRIAIYFHSAMTIMGRPPAFCKLFVNTARKKESFGLPAWMSKRFSSFPRKRWQIRNCWKTFPSSEHSRPTIIFSAAQTIPHGFDTGGNFGSSPVGIAVICDYAAQMLKNFIFIFHRGFRQVSLSDTWLRRTDQREMFAFEKFSFSLG